MTVREWLQANGGRYGSKEETIQACMSELGVGRRVIQRRIHSAVVHSRPAATQSTVVAISTGGLTREQARMRHDTPARLAASLDAFIVGLKDDNMREESEVLRACKVASSEAEYWQQTTAQPKYARHYGYTERNVRLWGTEADMRWAASTDGITGFRREV